MSPVQQRRYLRQIPPQLATRLLLALLARRMDRHGGLNPQLALPAPPQGFLTLAQASAQCGLSVGFLKGLIQMRKLPYLQDGQVVKVHSSHLAKLPKLAGLAESSSKLREGLKARRGK